MTRQAPDTASTDALHNPVKRQYTRREVSTADMEVRALDPVEDLADREDIIVADDSMDQSDYLKELAFMNEEVTVRLHRGREKHAPTFEMIGVNGRNIWVPVETPVRLKRSYVEVMARAQPATIDTESGEDPGDALTFNRVNRHLSAMIVFSVVHDPNPRGHEWLQKVMREN